MRQIDALVKGYSRPYKYHRELFPFFALLTDVSNMKTKDLHDLKKSDWSKTERL